jgi:hypothetical protein
MLNGQGFCPDFVLPRGPLLTRRFLGGLPGFFPVLVSEQSTSLSYGRVLVNVIGRIGISALNRSREVSGRGVSRRPDLLLGIGVVPFMSGHFRKALSPVHMLRSGRRAHLS